MFWGELFARAVLVVAYSRCDSTPTRIPLANTSTRYTAIIIRERGNMAYRDSSLLRVKRRDPLDVERFERRHMFGLQSIYEGGVEEVVRTVGRRHQHTQNHRCG